MEQSSRMAGNSVKLSFEALADSVTPEHLFAGAFGACFLGALKNAAKTAHLPTEGMTVVAKAYLEGDNRGTYRLAMELRAAMPGFNRSGCAARDESCAPDLPLSESHPGKHQRFFGVRLTGLGLLVLFS